MLPKFTQVVQHLSIDIKRPEGAQHREPALLNVGMPKVTAIFADIASTIQWQPSQSTAPSDGFSFTRSGTVSTDISIALYPAQQPRRFKIAPELGNVLDLREDSKLGILNAMWSYIQRERLLEASSNVEADRRNIKLDDALSRVCGDDSTNSHGSLMWISSAFRRRAKDDFLSDQREHQPVSVKS